MGSEEGQEIESTSVRKEKHKTQRKAQDSEKEKACKRGKEHVRERER